MTLRGHPLAVAVCLLVFLPAACSHSAPVTLCHSQARPVAGGEYTVQNNEWGSDAAECIRTDGGTGFTVTNSAIHATGGAPGGYPSIYKGCHWATCTPGSGLPMQVRDIRAGTVTTSWSTVQPDGGSIYNAAYDIWFNREPAVTGHPDGAELMIWLNHNGPRHPAGQLVEAGVPIGGRSYDVWLGRRGSWHAISYSMTSGTTSVTGLDLHPLIADALSRGYLATSWYLTGVEAGFELWQGGAGLATRSFSVTVTGRD